MSATRLGKWLDKASAQVLSDFRPGVWSRDNIARSRLRVAAVACMVLVLVILTSLSFIGEPSLRSRTYTYRVTNPAALPSGSRIVSSSCPCSKNMLPWSGFVAWPRFASNQSSATVNAYCNMLLYRRADPPPPPDTRHTQLWPSGASSSPALSPASSPSLRSQSPSGPPPTDSSRGGRHLLQEDPPVQPSTAEFVEQEQDDLLFKACTVWVQDVAASLDPSNLAYNAEAYQASQLKTLDGMQEFTKLWLGSKLKYHLQLQYYMEAPFMPLDFPQSYQQLLAAVRPQLDSMFASVFAEIKDHISYARYKDQCNAPHCDVIATKPAYAYVIDNLAKFGGLCSNVLLVTAIVWHTVTAIVPTLEPYDEAISRVGLVGNKERS